MMMRKWMLSRIGLWSAVKTGGAVSATAGFFFGALCGIAIAFFSSLVASAITGRASGFGAVAMLIMPVFCMIFFGAFGAVAAFLSALFYNIVAGLFGGLELEMESGESEEPRPRKQDEPPAGPVSDRKHRIWKPSAAGMSHIRLIAPHRRGPLA